MAYWLLKTEPDEYSFDDLLADGTAEWDGVTANPAQAQLRQVVAGDTCVIYHTGDVRAAIGEARVARGPYPDPTDPNGKRVWIDLRAEGPLGRPVSLAQLKATPAFAESPLLRMSRLSVVPLTDVQYAELRRLSQP